MKKQKPKETQKKGLSWWEWVLITILILYFLNLLGCSDDYKLCVDKCISSLDDCHTSATERIGNDHYIREYDADMCYYRLKDCVWDCKT